MKRAQFLAKNLGHFKKMKSLAQRQMAAFSTDEIGMFFNLSSERDRLRQEITTNERNYKGLLKGSPGETLDDESRGLCTEIADVIRSIQEMDKNTEELVLRKREAFLTDIRNLRSGQKAVRGYGGKPARGAKFINREG